MAKLVGRRSNGTPVYERFSMRAWLIRKLVGRSPVCMNCTIRGQLEVKGSGGVIAGNMIVPLS